MSSTKGLEIKVGLLVFAGLAATVVMILATDRIGFEDTYIITAYLEDAGGLRTGSRVEMAGIPIGNVQSVTTTRDPRGPIKATLEVRDDVGLTRSSRLVLSTRGLFGDPLPSFQPGAEDDVPLPIDGSAEMTVEPTLMDRLTGKIEGIIAGLAEMTDENTRAEFKQLVANANALVAESRGAMTRLEQRTAGLDRLIAEATSLSTTLHENQAGLSVKAESALEAVNAAATATKTHLDTAVPRLEALAESGAALATEGRGLIERSDVLLAAIAKDREAILTDVKAFTGDLRQISGGLLAGRGVFGQLLTSGALARDLNTIAINFEGLSERLAEHPEVLIFGSSNEDRRKARERREERQVRRAFMAGFEYHDPQPEAEMKVEEPAP
ncbi:MAG: MlaD family protein [Planctomycetota bacterium]